MEEEPQDAAVREGERRRPGVAMQAQRRERLVRIPRLELTGESRGQQGIVPYRHLYPRFRWSTIAESVYSTVNCGFPPGWRRPAGARDSNLTENPVSDAGDGSGSSGTGSSRRKRVTTSDLIAMKGRGEKIAMLTCYDYLFAGILTETAVDAVLVGDSLGQVVLGHDSTLPVTVDDMIHHACAVRRGLQGPLLIVDMPFLSYQVSDEDALRNAGRVMRETGAEAVKLEGATDSTLERIRLIVDAGIPVMGHLGLTPQSVHELGGYSVRGRERKEADRLRHDAGALEEAGCFSIVLELMPTELAGEISRSIRIPTIGIGAGAECDGQVLVLPDMLGLNPSFNPTFLRRFAELGEAVRRGVDEYVSAVKSSEYPADSESYEG
jgi:3-methyl-2-oxobutanoate hydroxymethyltransferase